MRRCGNAERGTFDIAHSTHRSPVTSEHLPLAVARSRPIPAAPHSGSFPEEVVTLEAIQRDLIEKALSAARNNKSQAAKLLGVPRGQLYSLLLRHRLTEARR